MSLRRISLNIKLRVLLVDTNTINEQALDRFLKRGGGSCGNDEMHVRSNGQYPTAKAS